jgi:thiol-disulfide isomerase/thioredoxin
LQTQGGSKAYNFTLIDKDGKGHVLEEYRGNVLLLDFWFLGCGNCQRVYPYIDSIATLLKEKKIKFLVLSINIDGRISAWEKGIASGKYTSENEVNLNTAGKEGANCLERYNITGCPTLILIDKNGKIMKQPIDPRADKGKDLISQILHG